MTCGQNIEELRLADVLFVFGGIRSEVAEQAAMVWNRGLARHILVSGKLCHPLPPPFLTEADFYADIMIRNGIPDRYILREREATNTAENVLFGLKMLRESQVFISSIIAVTRPPLMRRALATLRHHASDDVHITGLRYDERDWHNPEGTPPSRIAGEVDRLIAYGEKGDIARVEIPTAVLQACEHLRGSAAP
ncbi:MAG: YdcF family protein [bacterium]|nr:YdcF family protein [bacterium]